jgi:hypothetical protein
VPHNASAQIIPEWFAKQLDIPKESATQTSRMLLQAVIVKAAGGDFR